jgi:hypothetical protein
VHGLVESDYFGASDLFLGGVTDTRKGGFWQIRGGIEFKNPWKNAGFAGYLWSFFRIKSPLLYQLSYALSFWWVIRLVVISKTGTMANR